MKEKIFKILHNRKRMPGERFGDIEGKIENFVNQEVEKRIAERMPSEREIGNTVLDYCANPTEDGDVDFDQKQGYAFQHGIEWLRSRLTNPNNNPK